MHDFYSTAAQVLPVLFLAIVFELRTLSGRGPNVYQALGIPVQLPGAPRWFWRSYSTILVLVPATMFVGEAAALFVLSGHGPTHASCYWTAGALVIGGLTVVIPFFAQGLRGWFFLGDPEREREFAERPTHVLFAVAAGALVAYVLGGLLSLFL